MTDSSALAELARVRGNLEAAKRERTRLVEQLARREQERAQIRRMHDAEDRAVAVAEEAHRLAVVELRAVRKHQAVLRDELNAHIGSAIAGNPGDDIAALPGLPIVLLPVRLETRFVSSTPGGPGELLVRIYPDAIMSDAHEPALTASEAKAGQDYWRAAWEQASERDAWPGMAEAFGPNRAAWIVRQTQPSNLAKKPDKPLSSPQFPDRDKRCTPAEYTLGLELWRDAWREGDADSVGETLAGIVGKARAKVVREATEPLNAKLFPKAPQPRPEFPSPTLRAANWQHAPEARLLPDRWIVKATRVFPPAGEATEYTGVGAPIREPLALTLTLGDDGDPVEGGAVGAKRVIADGLAIDPEIEWTVNFAKAEEAGMAVRLALTARDLVEGLARLVVVGVKTTMSAADSAARLEQLLDSHHYTRGMAFVRQGTPTNNTAPRPSGYPPRDPAWSESFRVERGTPLAAPGTDGARFMRALGLGHSAADHIAGADGDEGGAAGAMAEALWPATIGYFMEQRMAPGLDTEDLEWQFSPGFIDEVREHFVTDVRGRGPFAAFRLGDVPYGLLPVSLPGPEFAKPEQEDIDPGDTEALIRRQMWLWREALVDKIPQAPHVGRSEDRDADLVATLGIHANAREFYIRPILGYGLVKNAGLATSSRVLIRRGGGVDVEQLDRDEIDTAFETAFATDGYRFLCGFVEESLPDEPEVLSEEDPLETNYLASIVEWTDLPPPESTLPGRPPLLHLLARHAILIEYSREAYEVLRTIGQLEAGEEREWQLRGMSDGTSDAPTIWERFATNAAELGVDGASPGHTLAQHLVSVNAASRVKAALGNLQFLPSAELERLLTETLDACSYRLDAWITSIATKRLREIRSDQLDAAIAELPIDSPEAAADDALLDSFVGAYGWVEHLKPLGEVNNRGYVYAPSMAHGSAAAVLLNAHMTRSGGAQEHYAINLSSARVRAATLLLDGVRAGQPLGAVLGYLFERSLHDNGLDAHIDELRSRYPLVANKLESSRLPAESIAARNVVDGFEMLTAWREARDPTASFAAVQAELEELDEAVDALADLLTAEATYQSVSGTAEGAAATVDAVARGAHAPQPAIAKVPVGGTGVTHRVAVALQKVELAGAWAKVPLTPRAAAAPDLNAWAGVMLGDPSRVRCRVQIEGGASVDINLAKLELQPLDVLAVAGAGEAATLDAELDRRVATVALELGGEHATGIEYLVRDLDDDERSFAELLEIARAVNAVLASARGLEPGDLMLPHQVGAMRAVDVGGAAMVEELDDRAAIALSELDDVRKELAAALAAAEQGAKGHGDLLRPALRRASLFGVASCYPLAGKDEDLSALGASVARELDRRAAMAVEEPDAIEKLRAVFGRAFKALRRFTLPLAEELDLALAAGPELGKDPRGAVATWVAQAARVRKPFAAWRRLMLYARTLAEKDDPQIVQLPHDERARWVALGVDAGEAPPAGKVSIALYDADRLDASEPLSGLLLDEWVELIPNAEEDAGVVFHYDRPGAEAPQAVLIAVPPAASENWSLDTLLATLDDTLELAQLRAVDGEHYGEDPDEGTPIFRHALYDKWMLPMVCLAECTEDGATIAVSLRNCIGREED